ncbi:MAG: hypothetical protein HQL75_10815 [Magnetococcales bacterium]|nr:hypothetical protein [Magnetococcales bacterium]
MPPFAYEELPTEFAAWIGAAPKARVTIEMTTPEEAEEIEAALHESLKQIGQGDASPTFEDADALFQYLDRKE